MMAQVSSVIKTFKAISNGALKGPNLPGRLKVFGWGANDSTRGTFTAGDKTASTLSVNQSSAGYTRVAIDFDHCTVPGTPTHDALLKAGQPPLIFGYGRVNPIAGDGIYLEEITWTPLGIQHARNFEDLSPAIKDDNGEVTLVHSVALTPNGAVTGLQFFSASNNPTFMAEPKFITLSALAGILGLNADADEAAVLTKLKTSITPPAVAPPAAAPTVTLAAELVTALKPLTDKLAALETKLATAEQAATAGQAEGIIRTFSVDGKVPKKGDGTNYSAEELKKLDLTTLQILAANTPVTVPLSARNAAHATEQGKSFRVKVGDKDVVDMAAIFDSEAKKSGLTATPPSN